MHAFILICTYNDSNFKFTDFKMELECAVDGSPSQICKLYKKFNDTLERL